MCGCSFNFQCQRHQPGGLWQAEEWGVLLDDPRFDRLVDESELLSLAEFRREAAQILGAVPVRRG